MKNPLTRYFLIFLSAVILIVCFYALFIPVSHEINTGSVSFTTQQSSEIYFKNMRSYFYDKEENEKGRFILYRIRSREKDSSFNKLSFVLVHNWRLSECYILPESGVVDLIHDTLVVGSLHQGKEQLIKYLQTSSSEAFVFAAELYKILQLKGEVFLITNNEKLLLSEKETRSLRKTLKDYFKLTGKIR